VRVGPYEKITSTFNSWSRSQSNGLRPLWWTASKT